MCAMHMLAEEGCAVAGPDYPSLLVL